MKYKSYSNLAQTHHPSPFIKIRLNVIIDSLVIIPVQVDQTLSSLS